MQRFPILIPSKGRPNCPTAKWLQGLGREFYIVVEPQDYPKYREFWNPHDLMMLHGDDQGICYVRNEILQFLGLERANAADTNGWIWMMDDDISGLAFQNIETRRMYSKKNPMPYTENELLDWMEACLRWGGEHERVALGSGQHVFLAWASGSDWALNAACVQMTALNVKKMENLTYDSKLGLLEDLDMCLQVIRAGYRTMRINRVAPLVPDNGSKEGGLGLYKGTQLEEDAARAVAAKWPSIVQPKLDRRGRYGLRVKWWAAAPTAELQQKVKDEGQGPQIMSDEDRRLAGGIRQIWFPARAEKEKGPLN